jgi:hypothetical protein
MTSIGMANLTSKNPEVLVDNIGERLALERPRERLYDAPIRSRREREVRAQAA